MNLTLVIVCSQCGGLLLAKDNQKTRTCPYCGSKIDLRKSKTMASAENSYEASALLRKLKDDAIRKQRGVSHQSRL